MKAIVARSQNNAIGFKGLLPWNPIKEDMKLFREFTMNSALLVGYNTAKTLPSLYGRRLIIDNRNKAIDNDLIVIGGTKTYYKYLPSISLFRVTELKFYAEGDVFFSYSFVPEVWHKSIVYDSELLVHYEYTRIVD